MNRLIGLLYLMSSVTFGASNVYEFTMNSIDGRPLPLANFKGKVMMVVNVASQCGYTPQYKGLEAIYEKYRAQGLVVVGIPANNFLQEPGTNEEIQKFCSAKYNVTFPMYSKTSVAGKDKTPLYQYLTDPKVNSSTGGEIQWNFTKFLVDRDGKVIQRFEPDIEPTSPQVTAAIEKALK